MLRDDPLHSLCPNNLGGREKLSGELFNHHLALKNAKPSFDSRKKPHQHVDEGRVKQRLNPLLYQKLEQYGNVYRTFKAIAQTEKGKIDSKKPHTMTLKHMNMDINKPKIRQSKKHKFTNTEHMRELQSQQQRCQQVAVWSQRLKNKNDPIAHPTIQFRDEANKKDVLKKAFVPGAFSPPLKVPFTNASSSQLKRAQSAKKDYAKEGGGGEPIQGSKYQDKLYNQKEKPNVPKPVKDKSKLRPHTAKEIHDEFAESGSDFVHEIPKVTGQSEDDYQYVKVELIKLIVKYRIYTNEDLECLFGRTLLVNQHLDFVRLDEIFKELKSELDA